LGKARDGKVDYVVVDNSLYDLILKYIDEYNITNYLITSVYKNDGSKVTNKTIRFIVKQMLRRVGIDDNKHTMHSCRHTFATVAIQNGADIRQVQQAWRHKSLETSMIYLHDLEARNNPCSGIVSNMVLGD
jgi:site-specific recombinase XerD